MSRPPRSATTNDRSTRSVSNPSTATALDRPAGADRLRRLAGTTAGEHGQPGQEPLLGFVEQVVGPVDRGPQRLLAFHRPAPPPASRSNRRSNADGQLRRAHRRHPRRGQLDRQGHPVETTTHLPHRRPVRRTEHEIGVGRAGTLHEQLHRFRRADRRQIRIRRSAPPSAGTANIRSPSRARPSRLVASTTTRGQVLTDLLDQVGDRVQHVLTVVDHQQQLLRLEELRQCLRHALARPGAHPEHRGERIDHVVGIAHRRQLDQPRTFTEPGQHLRRDLQRQTGLADPTHPRQRHHPRLAQRGHRAVDLTLPADERTRLQRQVPRERIDRRQRRELRPNPGAHTWNTRSARDRSRSRCSPRSTSVDALGQHVARQDRRSPASTRPARRARRPSAAPHDSTTNRSSHHHAATPLPVCRPIRTRNGSGNGHTSPSSARCAATAATTPASAVPNAAMEPVARGLDHIAAVGLDRLAQQLVVTGQRVAHRVGMLLPQARRTLDVGEQERDRPRRQLRQPDPLHRPSPSGKSTTQRRHAAPASDQRGSGQGTKTGIDAQPRTVDVWACFMLS